MGGTGSARSIDVGVWLGGDTMQRAFPRAPFTGNVTFFEWGHPREGVAAGIGGNGVFVRTRDLSPVGSFVTLRLHLPLPRNAAFTVLGKVVRVVRGGGGGMTPSGMGIEFLDIGAGHRQDLLEFIRSRAPAAA